MMVEIKLNLRQHPCSGGEFFLEVSFSQGATREKNVTIRVGTQEYYGSSILRNLRNISLAKSFHEQNFGSSSGLHRR